MLLRQPKQAAVLILLALVVPSCAFLSPVSTPLLKRGDPLWRMPYGCACAAAADAGIDEGCASIHAGMDAEPRKVLTRAAALRISAASVSAAVASIGALPSPALAGTVMVGGAAVDAEEETDDEAYEALDQAGPFDGILAKINVKKLGVAGDAAPPCL